MRFMNPFFPATDLLPRGAGGARLPSKSAAGILIIMKLVERFDRASLEKCRLVAESSEFAIFDIGNDTYALVHRHEAVAWQGITISGEGIFRIGELLARATRSLYRDVAAELSKERNR
jgi:hypothetical protein